MPGPRWIPAPFGRLLYNDGDRNTNEEHSPVISEQPSRTSTTDLKVRGYTSDSSRGSTSHSSPGYRWAARGYRRVARGCILGVALTVVSLSLACAHTTSSGSVDPAVPGARAIERQIQGSPGASAPKLNHLIPARDSQ